MAEKTGSVSVKPDWWSWKDVVQNRHLLSIPHFQRGSVWDRGNRVALLESLVHASPCGSFVLWKPDSGVTDVGSPLVLCDASRGAPWVPDKALWLVDGQQRSRSLLALYKELLRNNDASRHLICRDDLERLLKIWPQDALNSSDGSSDSLAEDGVAEADGGELDTETRGTNQESAAEVSDLIECARRLHPKLMPSERPTMKELIGVVARMGGHIKQNGPPGWQVLYRGFVDLLHNVQLLQQLGIRLSEVPQRPPK
jgi:hypothetical protein